MLTPTENFVSARDIRLRYVDWGDNGPLVLLLHGDMRTSRSWDAVARDLRDRFHVIALDARGHGDSDWTPRGYTLQERVNDLGAFCDCLELKDAVGVGHSTGGAVIALCARQRPGTFERVLLMEPLVVLDEAFQRRVAPRASQRRRTWASREELHEYLKRHKSARRWREDVIRDVVEHETMELPDGSIDMKWAIETFNWEERRDDRYDLRPLFRSLDLPVLFLISQRGRERREDLEELRPIAEKKASFHASVVAKSGHNMYMEQPEAIAAAIRAFSLGERVGDTI